MSRRGLLLREWMKRERQAFVWLAILILIPVVWWGFPQTESDWKVEVRVSGKQDSVVQEWRMYPRRGDSAKYARTFRRTFRTDGFLSRNRRYEKPTARRGDKRDSSFTVSRDREYREKASYYKKPEVRPVDINRSDSLDWLQLPGIGPGYTRRILRFRERLGGFHTVAQVAETWGLPDSVFRRIEPLLRCDSTLLRKISLNRVGMDSLQGHPYIDKALSRTLVEYRSRHGPFRDEQDLRKVWLVTDEWLRRIRPYLELGDGN